MRLVPLALTLVLAFAAALPAPSAASAEGRTATVKLKTGRSLSGAVLADGVWEKRDASGAWSAAKREDAGAGVRVWYVDGLDGYLFVRAADVQDVVVEGAWGDAEKKAQDKLRADAERRAADERKALAEKRARQDAADAKAAEDASRTAGAVAEAKAKAAEEAKIAGWKALLAEFPEDKWKVESPEEIRRRSVVVGVLPNAEERRFLAVFADWKAATEWKKADDEKKAKEKAAAAARDDGAAREKSEKPEPAKPAPGDAAPTAPAPAR